MASNLIVCGGTFDHFHKGHRSFLKLAFSLGQKVVIGVTSDDYVRNLKSRIQNSEFEEFEVRQQGVLEFIKREGALDRVEIIEIDDVFGPTLSKDLEIDAIVVSQDTIKGIEFINKRRKKLGLKELNILIAPQVLAEDGKIVSSRRIRNGEINREGELYANPLWFKKDLVLPENLRREFKKPFGELLTDTQSLAQEVRHLVITVGDVTTKIFNEKLLGQRLSVIDFKVAREKKFFSIRELGFSGHETIITADNPAGYLTANLFKKLAEIFELGIREKTILQINGEEDLVALPLVLFSSLNTIIYYGQPWRGLVKIVVSEKAKEKAYNLILKLKSA